MEQRDHWRGWIGRSEHRVDQVRAAPVAALAATLDKREPEPLPGGDLPPLWHWLYFTPLARTGEIDGDGSFPGDLLASLRLPPPTCTSGRVWFHRPLRIDDEITRVSRIVDVAAAGSANAPSLLLTIRHEITNALGLAITEEQSLVLGQVEPAAASPDTPPEPPAGARFRSLMPSPLLLFRYAALTFDGRRIHYDRAYATGTAGHPGLVLQTPLLALLLIEELRQAEPRMPVRSFAFKSVRPLFDTTPLELCVCTEPAARGGRRAALWARERSGGIAMQAQAELVDS